MEKEQIAKNRLLEQMARKAEKNGQDTKAEKIRDKKENSYGWLYILILAICFILLWLAYNGTISLTPLLERFGIYGP